MLPIVSYILVKLEEHKLTSSSSHWPLECFSDVFYHGELTKSFQKLLTEQNYF